MLLAEAGIASRRHAEAYIRAGRVTVNGRIAGIGERADPRSDRILLDGRPVEPRQETVCYLLNKPRGVLTTLSDPAGRPSVADYTAALPWRLFPVGRLDRDSEGLLLLTNDGMLANGLMHPRYHVRKTYAVTLDRPLAEGERSRLRQDIALADGPVRLLRVAVSEDGREVEVEIAEGRKRIVRRAFAAMGREVLRLRRIAIGPIRDPALREGQMRPLRPAELEALWGAIRQARGAGG